MDLLRSPGGCPWDAEQTHESLAPYLIEETYEVLEAIETGDSALLREELGDLFLQVLFHARIATELPLDQSWSVDDVAADLVAKLIRRHPHVFDNADASISAEAVNANWEQLKALEKKRTSVTDGVPMAVPALALASKLVARAGRAGLPVAPPPANEAEEVIGARLLEVVRDAVAQGVDPEAALRRTARRLRDDLLAAEKG
jgi:XTP/dITP diphosphohydrolase